VKRMADDHERRGKRTQNLNRSQRYGSRYRQSVPAFRAICGFGVASNQINLRKALADWRRIGE
jgi:hypothetical protein